MAHIWTCRKSFIAIAALFLFACGDDNNSSGSSDEVVTISDKTVSGVSQKGPFVNGSSVSVQELDGETLAQTGLGFEGKIKNDMGEFSVKVKKLESQYALLKANGFYRNEVTGKKSNSPVTLYALTDLSNRDEVNVNLLTHLAYERTLYLATEENLPVAEAKKQAESEVFKSFGIDGDFDAAEDLNIFGEDDQSAALLAVSVLMQGNLSEADFSERLANYAADIEADGVWDDYATVTLIADWASAQGLGNGLENIRKNITGWNLSTGVSNFEKYVNKFWWLIYSLGMCDEKREGEVKKNENEVSINADEYYICKSESWQVASDLEKDTYGWKAGKDGKVKNGSVVEKNCYVYEDSAWRAGNESDCSLGLRGCTQLRQDTVGEGSDKEWYICDEQKWRIATDFEKDTATWGVGKFDGEVRKGQINDDFFYIYEVDEKSWREATTLEKDTYDYENNRPWGAGKDGEIKKGTATETIYVFDENVWRVADKVEKVLGGCIEAKADSITKVNDSYYICTSRKWVVATALQYDTYKKECLIDGSIVDGNVVSSNKYVCDDGVFREASENDLRAKLGCTSYTRGELKILNGQYSYYKCESSVWVLTTEKLNLGTVTDERDGREYKTIGIGSQMWMAENLNYSDDVNFPSMLGKNTCYMNNPDSCEKYGRFYTWTAAIDSIYWANQGKKCGYENDPLNNGTCDLPNEVQGICFDGWHLPSVGEWQKLYSAMNDSAEAMQATGFDIWNNASDKYGFSVLPVGHYFVDFNQNGTFWTSTASGMVWAQYWQVGENNAGSTSDYVFSTKSVRCIKDEE